MTSMFSYELLSKITHEIPSCLHTGYEGCRIIFPIIKTFFITV